MVLKHTIPALRDDSQIPNNKQPKTKNQQQRTETKIKLCALVPSWQKDKKNPQSKTLQGFISISKQLPLTYPKRQK